jgi:transposase
MAAAPWIVSDELWELIEPLLPTKERHFRYPGRERLPDRQALQGILFVLHTGVAWQHLPAELGFGSGVTCWRRLDEWQRAGVWERLHSLLLARLRAAGEIEWARAIVDSSQVQAKKAGSATGPSPVDRGRPGQRSPTTPESRLSFVPQSRRRIVSSISCPRPGAKSRLTPMRRNPAFSSTRSERTLSEADRAYRGRSAISARRP